MLKNKNHHKLGKSVRNRGNSYERKIAEELRKLGWTKCCTSRAESKNKDSLGIDLCNTEPLNIQCKCLNTFKNPILVLEVMPKNNGNYNAVFTKVVHLGEYITMTKLDFYEIIKTLKKEEIW